ncbi:MAG: hypothetical protein ACFB10_07760 [Salibacteraceae bacterium]
MPENLPYFAGTLDASLRKMYKMMRLMIKIIFVVALLAGCLAGSLKAQADLEVMTMVSPIPGSSIDTGITFDLTFTIHNVGTVTVQNTDTISISLDIASNYIGSASFPPLNPIGPGDTYDFTISNVPSNYPGPGIPVCITLNWAPDLTLNNNVLCESYMFGNSTVGIGELKNGSEISGLYFQNGHLDFNWYSPATFQSNFRVIDIHGRTIHTGTLLPTSTTERQSISLPSLSSGVYFFSVYPEDGTRPTVVAFSIN